MTQTLKTGDLAYFDTFAGMIPCKVLAIVGRSGAASSYQMVTFQLTAKRGAYKRGEVIASSGLHVCPRGAVRVNGMIRYYEVVAENNRKLTR